jgi:hypothetical protein
MDKVRKPNISVCYTPSSEPYSIYQIIMSDIVQIISYILNYTMFRKLNLFPSSRVKRREDPTQFSCSFNDRE